MDYFGMYEPMVTLLCCVRAENWKMYFFPFAFKDLMYDAPSYTSNRKSIFLLARVPRMNVFFLLNTDIG